MTDTSKYKNITLPLDIYAQLKHRQDALHKALGFVPSFGEVIANMDDQLSKYERALPDDKGRQVMNLAKVALNLKSRRRKTARPALSFAP